MGLDLEGKWCSPRRPQRSGMCGQKNIPEILTEHTKKKLRPRRVVFPAFSGVGKVHGVSFFREDVVLLHLPKDEEGRYPETQCQTEASLCAICGIQVQMSTRRRGALPILEERERRLQRGKLCRILEGGPCGKLFGSMLQRTRAARSRQDVCSTLLIAITSRWVRSSEPLGAPCSLRATRWVASCFVAAKKASVLSSASWLSGCWTLLRQQVHVSSSWEARLLSQMLFLEEHAPAKRKDWRTKG